MLLYTILYEWILVVNIIFMIQWRLSSIPTGYECRLLYDPKTSLDFPGNSWESVVPMEGRDTRPHKFGHFVGRTWATSGSTCCAACLAGPDEENFWKASTKL